MREGGREGDTRLPGYARRIRLRGGRHQAFWGEYLVTCTEMEAFAKCSRLHI